LEETAEHGARHGVKIKKMWDSPDGYDGYASATIRSLSASDQRQRRSTPEIISSPIIASVLMSDLKIVHKNR
jgi:hypothetical protein